MRRLAISKICAVWIVGLILLPFTAPFRTYDLATSQSGSRDALPKEKVDADEKIVAPSDSSLVPPALSIVVASRVTRQSQIELHLLQHDILRL